jgi:nitrogenase molybdenum-iron protein alpha/beta subunit/MoaA/NifB/PqqE/SkfB family radical SAM enzyme
MSTHYNEPVDIASSSLTEEGTVFGGEKNLIKGLENLIRLYDPEVIGISTTCLAETIGEDIPRMIRDFREKRPDLRAKIITVASAGYAGTQYEGFFRALRAITEQVDLDPTPNGKVNIITGVLSPADTRFLKELLEEMGIDAILLPDLSENLDGRHEPEYRRLPAHGTSLTEIAGMAGTRMSIELASFIDEAYSPARYLLDAYGVPMARCALPVGLRDTDRLIELLKQAGGVVTPRIEKQRGRFLDAMVDSHKYNAGIRAAVFGEPDFVYAVCRLLAETGALAALAATGSVCKDFAARVAEEVRETALFHLDGDTVAVDDCDFDAIERYVRQLRIGLMIGSSDGRRIEEKTGVPLVRCAFPIHDHIGGQRVRTLGYEGGLSLLDRITNSALGVVEHSFRGKLYEEYYGHDGNGGPPRARRKIAAATGESGVLRIVPRVGGSVRNGGQGSETHPCFSAACKGNARIHLPVAPDCNIRCNYCVRRYDCPNESRPGVASAILSPQEAYERYMRAKEQIPRLTVAGIAGPGDALANADATFDTLRRIRAADPDVDFCISTNGLALPTYADDLARLGVSHATVTINAADPVIGARIYRRVEYMGARYSGETGAALLMANQFAGLTRLRQLGVVCKVNIVMLKGVNDAHIPAVVERVREAGCAITNIMRMIPVEGSLFGPMAPTGDGELAEMRKRCGAILPQMYHCRQCRADAAGTLDEEDAPGACLCDAQGVRLRANGV